MSENSEKNIGVVGFSAKKFDEKLAESILSSFLDAIETLHPESDKCSFVVVSGLTNLGIPGLAYKLAEKRKWKTIGVACKKAEEYECFDVDESIIVGDDWGDESETFLKNIDLLIRIGGGDQSLKEAKMADKMGLPVIEIDLPETKN